MLLGVNSAWAQTHTETYDFDGDGVEETYNVVYLNLGGGNDNNDGSATSKAVKTWGKAYKLLPNYIGTTDAERDAAWDKNIIVVLYTTNNATASIKIDEAIAKGNGAKGIPVTITGVWPWTAENTTAAKVKAGGILFMNATAHNTTTANGSTRLGADTKFKYIRFGGGSSTQSRLNMYLHDTYFDVGVVMNGISTDLSTNLGALRESNGTNRKSPDVQLQLFADTYAFSTTTPTGNSPITNKPVTLTIRSGKFGRIISSRITGTNADQVKARYVVGSPQMPLLGIINIDIDPETSTGEWNPRGDVDDIAFLCSGSTQGTEYCDIQYNIKRGRIATLVAAMQGNTIAATKGIVSNSSYFGRTITNIIAENDNDVIINRYYAACFGRMTSGQDGVANAAFYGKSILNMYGGTIENGVYVSAGGVSGLVSPYNPEDYTNDQYIPYIDNSSAYKNYPYMGLHYQKYDKNKSIVHVTSSLYTPNEDIDLNKTITEMNIHGGVIRGGVFGGSYGFSPELFVNYAMPKGGSLWGETNVNIYGGSIYGGVYGGGEGSSNYFNLATADKRNDFASVATVYGNTNVNIYGGFIEGGIFGGGKGVDTQVAGKQISIATINKSAEYINSKVTTVDSEEFLDIAKVVGNTTVIVDPRKSDDFDSPNPEWTFTGNIYGGGALGAVEGETNVIIKGGIINGNVFGGGKGENGHPNKAKVTGKTNVIVDKDWTE